MKAIILTFSLFLLFGIYFFCLYLPEAGYVGNKASDDIDGFIGKIGINRKEVWEIYDPRITGDATNEEIMWFDFFLPIEKGEWSDIEKKFELKKSDHSAIKITNKRLSIGGNNLNKKTMKFVVDNKLDFYNYKINRENYILSGIIQRYSILNENLYFLEIRCEVDGI